MKLSATDRRNLRTLLLVSVFEPESIGARIAQARREKGLTQEELGDLVDLATRTVQNHEAGATTPYKHLRAYAEMLGVEQRWLLHGDETEKQPASPAQVAEEIEEVRALLLALVADRGLDAEQILRAQHPPDAEPQRTDEAREPPAPERRAG